MIEENLSAKYMEKTDFTMIKAIRLRKILTQNLIYTHLSLQSKELLKLKNKSGVHY